MLPAMLVAFLLLFMSVLHFLLHPFVCHHSWSPMPEANRFTGHMPGASDGYGQG